MWSVSLQMCFVCFIQNNYLRLFAWGDDPIHSFTGNHSYMRLLLNELSYKINRQYCSDDWSSISNMLKWPCNLWIGYLQLTDCSRLSVSVTECLKHCMPGCNRCCSVNELLLGDLFLDLSPQVDREDCCDGYRRVHIHPNEAQWRTKRIKRMTASRIPSDGFDNITRKRRITLLEHVQKRIKYNKSLNIVNYRFKQSSCWGLTEAK